MSNHGMKVQCKDCPFRPNGAPLRRLGEIKEHSAVGGAFHCHKTTHLPRSRWIECRGALDYRAGLTEEQRDAHMTSFLDRVNKGVATS